MQKIVKLTGEIVDVMGCHIEYPDGKSKNCYITDDNKEYDLDELTDFPDYDKRIILGILYLAKERYLRDITQLDAVYNGLCYYLAISVNNVLGKTVTYSEINTIIPEFNLKTFNVNKETTSGYWWKLKDFRSRTNALNTLIEIYKNK